MIVLFILLSGLLYRVRGSDEIISGNTQIKRIIWAAPTAYMATQNIYLFGVLFLYIWLMVIFVEKSDADYGPQPQSRLSTNYKMLSLSGLILFNPFFSLVHYLTFKYRSKLPVLRLVEGHAEWAELINGTFTAASIIILTGIVEGLI